LSDSEKLSDHIEVTQDSSVMPGETAELFAVLARRWAPHVLYALARPARFTELQKAIPGISATSLNDRLRDLSGHGLVVRHVFAGPPMSTLYEATEAGAIVSRLLWTLSEAKRSASPPPPGEGVSLDKHPGPRADSRGRDEDDRPDR